MSTPTDQNPYGQPPEDQYGQQNPYGQPQNPYGQPFYAAQPEQGRSGMAIAGLCTFFVPLVGLILSIIGMVQTGAGKMRGRGIAVTALILSILASVVWGIGIGKVASKTSALDPGCTNGKAAILDGTKKFETDSAGGDEATIKADIQAIVDNLNSAIAKSHRSDVKTAMQNTAADYTALGNGQFDADLMTKLQTDLQQVDNLCTIK